MLPIQPPTSFYAAQQEYFAAITEAQSLQAQADEQSAIAETSARRAGQVAAQLYRNGGDDSALQLFFSGSAANADELLSRLGTMDKLLEYNRSVYDGAISARNTAQSLTDQAKVARDERDRLQQVAEQKMIAAQEAADAAQAALDEQAANLETMQAQLAALKDTTTQTVAGYQSGVAAREAEERARREREAAEAAANGGGNGGGGGSAGSGGWVRPPRGRPKFKLRPADPDLRFRRAAPRATTTARTWPMAAERRSTPPTPEQWTTPARTANYGNYVRIQHGGGVSTGYAHIKPSGILVGRGQWVNSGQVIAYAGDTGRSFGCHLHFEVYINGGYTNPVRFMEDRGVYI